MPKNLLFSEDHIWVYLKSNKVVRIGITEFLTSEDEEIQEIILDAEEGTEIEVGDIIGEIETSDGTVEIISPISGKVLKINQDVIDDPKIIIEDPYREGWLMEIEISKSIESFSLLSYKEYKEMLQDEK